MILQPGTHSSCALHATTNCHIACERTPTVPGTRLHTAGKYVDATADAEEVVAELEATLQRIGELGEALGVYNSYFTLFDASQDEMSSFMLAEKEANGRYQVRRMEREWTGMLKHLHISSTMYAASLADQHACAADP